MTASRFGSRRRFDVVIVGAGSAGSMAAYGLALRGLNVALVDGRDFGRSGSRWVNYVPPWMFDAAGLPRPESPELRATGGAFTIDAGDAQVTVENTPCQAVDMRALVARLQGLALAAGVTPVERATVLGLDVRWGRPVSLSTSRGEFGAALFIDASGMNGAVRRRVPQLERDCPSLGLGETCTAAQAVYGIADPDAARAWVEARGLSSGQTVSEVGIAGGFSIMNGSIDLTKMEIDFLTGAVVGDTDQSGVDLLKRCRERLDFTGPLEFGGSGLLPMRRPYDRLVVEGVALLGNAACQIFPAHGSGVGLGLIAASMLASHVGGGRDPGELRALWTWQAAFQREYGTLCAAYDVVRRLTQRLSREEQARMIDAGLVTPRQLERTLDQRMVLPDVRDALSFARGLTREPRLALRVVLALRPMAGVIAAYRTYPEEPSERALIEFSSRVGGLFGTPPEVRG
ncbi:MAG: NAD(P)/FAD-dependent oxidoreductase [Myxococcales bacterium]|nr:NAD(P)/FAD-dependent oxidoreductase [Myxococcales bacterium]